MNELNSTRHESLQRKDVAHVHVIEQFTEPPTKEVSLSNTHLPSVATLVASSATCEAVSSAVERPVLYELAGEIKQLRKNLHNEDDLSSLAMHLTSQ